jgi:hypothetical protein
MFPEVSAFAPAPAAVTAPRMRWNRFIERRLKKRSLKNETFFFLEMSKFYFLFFHGLHQNLFEWFDW